MIQLLKYSFSRLYFFYRYILGIRQNTFLYPSVVIGFLLAFNILVIVSIPFLIVNSTFFNLMYPFGGVVIILVTMLYIIAGSRYKKILTDVEGYDADTLYKLKHSSIIYAAISIILFIWVLYCFT